jgi:hypothetical protein
VRAASLLVPLAVSASLCAVLAAELWPTGPTGLAMSSRPPVAREPTIRQALVAPVQDWVDDSLARPLFTQGRRPSSHEGGVAGLQGLPRLAGVIVAPNGRSAIFAGSGIAKPIIAAEGTQLGSYRVQSIEAGQVTVLGPEGTRVLHPSFAGAGAGATQAAPSALQQMRERRR